MATKKLKTNSKDSVHKEKSTSVKEEVPQSKNRVTALTQKTRSKVSSLMARRPHRSFQRTRRRDYTRSLDFPGYWKFTGSVRRVLWQHKKIFFGLVIFYGILSAALMGIASQDTYAQLSDSLNQNGSDIFQGNIGEVGHAVLLFGTGIAGSLSGQPTDIQRLYAILISLVTWLTTVWLLRGIVAGSKPKLRDGLYNATGPLLSTFLVSLVVIVQLLPIAVAAIGYGAASTSGLLDNGIEAMLFWTVASMLAALSLYWITSTVIALIVVTLPGVYPLRALTVAGDLVVGRRIRILLRILWLLFIDLLFWFGIMVPIILLDAWLKSVIPAIQGVPIVPVAFLIMSSFTIVWSSGYIYLMYRKVVDDDAAPA
jgi:hypothetical protein